MKLDRELSGRLPAHSGAAARGNVNSDKRDLMRSFDSRTAENAHRATGGEPDAVDDSALLLHLQGHSVPDRRTPLYDDYMKTFLKPAKRRERLGADNARTSRSHRLPRLVLQGLAEQQGSNGDWAPPT